MEHHRLADQCRKLRYEMVLLEQAEAFTQCAAEQSTLDDPTLIADMVPLG